MSKDNYLDKANDFSNKKLNELIIGLSSSLTKKEFKTDFLRNICVYVCGSLGRYELSEKSDLDLFFIYNKQDPCSNLEKYRFFSKIYDVNNKLGFKDPSKGGYFWDIISKKNLVDIGSRNEDYNNSFTARLLLILESKPIFNIKLYNNIVRDVVDAYFIDYEKHPDNFFPMFLINDILRYWFTLTLNHEHRRDKKDNKQTRCWKRLKLKFPRLLTCFSTLACLYKKDINPEYVIDLMSKTPMERLSIAAGENKKISSLVIKIKKEYNWFLSLTKENPSWWDIEENKKMAFKNADDFHELVVHKLLNEVSKNNIELKKRIEI